MSVGPNTGNWTPLTQLKPTSNHMNTEIKDLNTYEFHFAGNCRSTGLIKSIRFRIKADSEREATGEGYLRASGGLLDPRLMKGGLLDLSRQRRWQESKREEGLCCYCGVKPFSLYAGWCDECHEKRRDRARARSGSNPKQEGGAGRPFKGTGPKWDDVDWGRYNLDIASDLGVSSSSVSVRRAALLRANRLEVEKTGEGWFVSSRGEILSGAPLKGDAIRAAMKGL